MKTQNIFFALLRCPLGKRQESSPGKGWDYRVTWGFGKENSPRSQITRKPGQMNLTQAVLRGPRTVTAVGVAVFAQGASEEVPCVLSVQPRRGVASDGTRDWPWVRRFF